MTVEKTPAPWMRYHELDLQWPSWIITDILPARSAICLYGRRSRGKTFLALDWACSIASGLPWTEKKAELGRVAYLLAERPEGLKRRVFGWLRHRRLSKEDGTRYFDADGGHLFVSQARYALDRDDDLKRLLKHLGDLPPLSLVVFDPLVHFMDGAENDTRDMSRFVDGVNRIVKECGCSVLLVHHEGKGNYNNLLGARGSSVSSVLQFSAKVGIENSLVGLTGS